MLTSGAGAAAPTLAKILDLGKLHAERIGAGFGVCRQAILNLREGFLRTRITARDQHERWVAARIGGGFDALCHKRDWCDRQLVGGSPILIHSRVFEAQRGGAGALIVLDCARQHDRFDAGRSAIHDQRDVGRLGDLRGALRDLRDRQEISIGQAKVSVNGVARQMQRFIAAVLGEASEQSVCDPRRDRAFRVVENFTKQRALFLIVHRSKDLLHAVGNILDHVAGGVVHVRAALAIVALLGRAAVAIGDAQLLQLR